ncbi:MAG: glycosyltransferase [Candidatus Eisenbacteria bacterium]|uniref:Glycosyltransferase n=1 Tax=Eiseniibacteriota bacterium TaxID=2212470 RepID=A0A937XAZ5_UNCEI|nr:glycosyltransferase [Candidatus Eisenbacteria bacterium]
MEERPIRVALVIDAIDESMGGTERQLILLARNLDRARFCPYVVCLRATRWQEENPAALDMRVFEATRLRSPRTWLSMLRLSRFLAREGIDVVQTHFRDGNTIGTLCAFLARRGTIVSTRRGTIYWRRGAGLLLLRFLDAMATGFIANSRWAARALVEGERVGEERVRVIPNGTPAPSSPPPDRAGREGILRGCSLDPADAHVIAVGNLRRVKRHDILIRAAADIVRRHPRVRILLVGDGPERASLEALARAEGVSERVEFLGRRTDLLPLLQACDVGALCSDSESQANAILEYMAAGLPVVCTDVGGNGELVTDGANGFLVPAGDPSAAADRIGRLLADRALAARMGEESRKVAGAFSVQAMVDRTAAYYEELVARRGSGRRGAGGNDSRG